MAKGKVGGQKETVKIVFKIVVINIYKRVRAMI